MNEWMTEWMNERMNEWMNERVYDSMNVKVNGCMHASMHVHTYIHILIHIYIYTNKKNMYIFKNIHIHTCRYFEKIKPLKPKWLIIVPERRENPQSDPRVWMSMLHVNTRVNHQDGIYHQELFWIWCRVVCVCVYVCLDVQPWRPHEIHAKMFNIIHSWFLEPLLRPVKKNDTVQQGDKMKETQPNQKWPKHAKIIDLDTACGRKPRFGSSPWNCMLQWHSIAIDWYLLTPWSLEDSLKESFFQRKNDSSWKNDSSNEKTANFLGQFPYLQQMKSLLARQSRKFCTLALVALAPQPIVEETPNRSEL